MFKHYVSNIKKYIICSSFGENIEDAPIRSNNHNNKRVKEV